MLDTKIIDLAERIATGHKPGARLVLAVKPDPDELKRLAVSRGEYDRALNLAARSLALGISVQECAARVAGFNAAYAAPRVDEDGDEVFSLTVYPEAHPQRRDGR